MWPDKFRAAGDDVTVSRTGRIGSVGDGGNGVARIRMVEDDICRIGKVKVCRRSRSSTKVTALACQARGIADKAAMSQPSVLTDPVGAHISDRSSSIGGLSVAREAAARIIGRTGAVTANTADTNTADPIQGNTMAKRTGIGNVPGVVMERSTRVGGPVRRMGVVFAVTPFAAGTADAVDADIEARIGARAATFAMTNLASRQVGSSIGAMNRTAQVAAIQRMRNLLGTLRVATRAVEAGREATGGRYAP